MYAIRSYYVNLRAIGNERLADSEEGVQIMSKGIEVGHDYPVSPGKGVVGEHRRQRHSQPGGGHDQRLANRSGNFFRITSYNVCYTKLLRWRQVTKKNIPASRGRITALGNISEALAGSLPINNSGM